MTPVRRPADSADCVAAAADRILCFLVAENDRCKISLWQHDESGYGFLSDEHAALIDLEYFAKRLAAVALNDGSQTP